MRNLSIRSAIVAAMSLAFVSSASAAGDTTTYTIQMSGYVPVICRATLDQNQISGASGQADLGDMREFCNDGSGYQVWLDYAPGVTSATVYVDGQAIALSQAGSTLISSSSTAASRIKHLALSLGDDAAALSAVSIRVVAL